MPAVLFIAKTLHEAGPVRALDSWSDTGRLVVPARAFKSVSFNTHCRSFH